MSAFNWTQWGSSRSGRNSRLTECPNIHLALKCTEEGPPRRLEDRVTLEARETFELRRQRVVSPGVERASGRRVGRVCVHYCVEVGVGCGAFEVDVGDVGTEFVVGSKWRWGECDGECDRGRGVRNIELGE